MSVHDFLKLVKRKATVTMKRHESSDPEEREPPMPLGIFPSFQKTLIKSETWERAVRDPQKRISIPYSVQRTACADSLQQLEIVTIRNHGELTRCGKMIQPTKMMKMYMTIAVRMAENKSG